MEKITIEKKGCTFTLIVTIYYINPSLSLSESLSSTTRSKKKRKCKRNEDEHLHYTTLKIENLALKSKTLSFWTSTGVFIGEKGF